MGDKNNHGCYGRLGNFEECFLDILRGGKGGFWNILWVGGDESRGNREIRTMMGVLWDLGNLKECFFGDWGRNGGTYGGGGYDNRDWKNECFRGLLSDKVEMTNWNRDGGGIKEVD